MHDKNVLRVYTGGTGLGMWTNVLLQKYGHPDLTKYIHLEFSDLLPDPPFRKIPYECKRMKYGNGRSKNVRKRPNQIHQSEKEVPGHVVQEGTKRRKVRLEIR